MEYRELLDDVKSLEFMQIEDTADAAIKAVLGILVSKLDEASAHRLTERLPEPLSFDKLRSHQNPPTHTDADSYFVVLSRQFNLTDDQVTRLVNLVLHHTRESIGDESFWREINRHLPEDWAALLDAA